MPVEEEDRAAVVVMRRRRRPNFPAIRLDQRGLVFCFKNEGKTARHVQAPQRNHPGKEQHLAEAAEGVGQAEIREPEPGGFGSEQVAQENPGFPLMRGDGLEEREVRDASPARWNASSSGVRSPGAKTQTSPRISRPDGNRTGRNP